MSYKLIGPIFAAMMANTAIAEALPTAAEKSIPPEITGSFSKSGAILQLADIGGDFIPLPNRYPQDGLIKEFDDMFSDVLPSILTQEEEFHKERGEDPFEYEFYNDIYSYYGDQMRVLADEMARNDRLNQSDPATKVNRLCIYNKAEDFLDYFSRKFERFMNENYNLSDDTKDSFKELYSGIEALREQNKKMKEDLEKSGISPQCRPLTASLNNPYRPT